MSEISMLAFVGFVGVLAEFTGASLLALLFWLLRRHAVRRPYFAVWQGAWIALGVAIAALAVRYAWLVTPDRWIGDDDPRMRLLYLAYQLGKLLFYALLMAGALMYARGTRGRPLLTGLAAFGAAYGGLSVLFSTDLSAVVLWQAPVAIAAFAVAAWLFVRLPLSRRSLGSRITAAFLAALALLWSVYFAAFTSADSLPGGWVGLAMRFVLQYNSYLDLLLFMLLGYGMVVLLLEDRQREVDDAHAELAVAHDALRRAALIDTLTGVLNRRAFAEGVARERASAGLGAVALVDVDDLKQVNDNHGHPAGDALLRHAAEALRGSLRAADKLYRWGGDEFLVLMPGAKADEARRRLGAAMAAAAPLLFGSERLEVSVSIGTADYRGAEGLDRAVERADKEMYAAKEARKVGR